MSNWTEETKAELVEKYQKANPTPENTGDLIQELAEEFETSANSVRMILSRAGVYVKKQDVKSTKTTSKSASKADGDMPARVSKGDAIASLQEAIESAGQAVDEEITSKLTGKAALYFAGIIKGIQTTGE